MLRQQVSHYIKRKQVTDLWYTWPLSCCRHVLMSAEVGIKHTLFHSLYPGQPGWTSTKTLRNITHIPALLSSNFSQALSTFPHRPPSSPLASNANKNPAKQLKETLRTRGQEPTLPLHCLIPDLMRHEVNRWSPLTHSSHSMTTSWPAAATQMRARGSPCTPRYFVFRSRY